MKGVLYIIPADPKAIRALRNHRAANYRRTT
jgi:hypothetical protein